MVGSNKRSGIGICLLKSFWRGKEKSAAVRMPLRFTTRVWKQQRNLAQKCENASHTRYSVHWFPQNVLVKSKHWFIWTKRLHTKCKCNSQIWSALLWDKANESSPVNIFRQPSKEAFIHRKTCFEHSLSVARRYKYPFHMKIHTSYKNSTFTTSSPFNPIPTLPCVPKRTPWLFEKNSLT